ncbi:DUF3822 family protein [Pontibacter akesuensis]|uniref:DUF3822 domain-containing protein n=1 Tax=Pontibacter akesuensis TaxID=388950 RepID=A0A1I7FXM0_9BACT|nr:DUF3822 family protein [Pontibacter akesuensis]GHA60019.1 hypothetical protein GCM10007389_10240 [Pontibacter akesuensis]SFU40871.1 Protein of unknown function [Pontibacter akesuensis]
MNTIHTHFRLSYKIYDEAFALSQAAQCHLYLSLSQKAIRFAVVDTARNKFVVLEDYELITVFTPLQVAEQLRLIAQENALLQVQNWKLVRVAVSNQQFTLVPETLYDPVHQFDYLRLHADLNPLQHEVYTYRHSGLEAINIFAVESGVRLALQGVFENQPLQLVHQTSALIRSILHVVPRNNLRSMYAFVERSYLTLLVVGPAGLEFCNVFHYTSPEDFIYYILFVMEEQKMNPEQETITLWGDITHDSSLFNILQKYVRQIKLGKKPEDVEYSYKFHDMFDHRYFELYSLHLCE